MRVVIGVITADGVLPEACKAIFDLDKAGCECMFHYVQGYDCASARNRIAQFAIEDDADYLLAVDSDVVLPKDALANMLEHGDDIVLGFYARRGHFDGTTTIIRKGSADHDDSMNASEFERMRDNGVCKCEVKAGGMGCALIRTSVFKRVGYPYYKWVLYKDGKFQSEDYYFFQQCRKAGIKVNVDTRVGCGHIFRHLQGSM